MKNLRYCASYNILILGTIYLEADLKTTNDLAGRDEKNIHSEKLVDAVITLEDLY